VPNLVLSISKYFDVLLEDTACTALTYLRKCVVVVMTVRLAFVLVVAVLRAKRKATYVASKVFDMVLAIESRDETATQWAPTVIAQQIETTKVICLTQWVLAVAITVLIFYWKELRGNDLAALLGDV
jgi:hypothetical protein